MKPGSAKCHAFEILQRLEQLERLTGHDALEGLLDFRQELMTPTSGWEWPHLADEKAQDWEEGNPCHK